MFNNLILLYVLSTSLRKNKHVGVEIGGNRVLPTIFLMMHAWVIAVTARYQTDLKKGETAFGYSSINYVGKNAMILNLKDYDVR